MLKRIDTKEEMANALLTLLNTYSLREITITQITQEAHISRKTFYLNFNSKEDILDYYVGKLGSELIEEITEIDSMDVDKLILAFFSFWERQAVFLTIISQNNLFYKLIPRFEILLRELFSELDFPQKDDEVVLLYSSSYHASGICKMFELWASNNLSESAEEITKYFKKIRLSNI